VTTLEAPPAPTANPDSLRRRALASLSTLPPFSPILSKLMASLAGEDVSFLVLGDLIEKDTVVAANILRVVNSAIYARRGTVASVRHALSILGVTKVRNIVLGMSVSRMLNQTKTPPGWSMENFNKHAAAVAMMSDLLVQHIKTDYAEGAFVAGLLHDMGRLLIVMGLPNEYATIFERHRATGEPFSFCEQEVLGFTHAALSGDAMNDWKLPTEIRLAVSHHHNPPRATDGQPIPLARILQAADAYVNGLGLAIVNDPRLDDPTLALAGLPLNETALAKIMKQFEAEHGAIAQFYH
jgi:HD-like signal output (HDOD) protein